MDDILTPLLTGHGIYGIFIGVLLLAVVYLARRNEKMAEMIVELLKEQTKVMTTSFEILDRNTQIISKVRDEQKK